MNPWRTGGGVQGCRARLSKILTFEETYIRTWIFRCGDKILVSLTKLIYIAKIDARKKNYNSGRASETKRMRERKVEVLMSKNTIGSLVNRIFVGGFEHLVMLTIEFNGGESYGAEIARQLEVKSGRSFAIAQIYVTLSRLQKKGLLESRVGDSEPVQGGRSKRLYRLSEHGRRVLRENENAISAVKGELAVNAAN